MLASRPVRRRNLAELKIDTGLVVCGDQRWIILSDCDTKNEMPLEVPLPDVLVPYMDTWVSVHRPVLIALRGRWHQPPQDALWISADGSPMTQMAIYDRVIALTRQGLGKALNPHLIRDCVTTTTAIRDPAGIGGTTALLGHRVRTTTERYYNHAGSGDAARRLQSVVFQVRNKRRRGRAAAHERD